MDPSTPTTYANETIRTVSFEQDGVEYVAPTIRREKEGLSRLSDEKAIKEAVVRGDAIRVPKGMSGTEFSKELSKMVEQARIHRGRKATSTAETSTDG
jgi:hypothetical protein